MTQKSGSSRPPAGPWHISSLEKIFIGSRICRDIEEKETREGVIAASGTLNPDASNGFAGTGLKMDGDAARPPRVRHARADRTLTRPLHGTGFGIKSRSSATVSR